jgi:osmoprotectant transport system ATP-binding protein
MPTTPLIAYANVGKTFDGGRVVAVDDVSLEVAEGEFLAIVGGSGSGKTTLLRLANRLIEADSGSITVEGEDVRNVERSCCGGGSATSSRAAGCFRT